MRKHLTELISGIVLALVAMLAAAHGQTQTPAQPAPLKPVQVQPVQIQPVAPLPQQGAATPATSANQGVTPAKTTSGAYIKEPKDTYQVFIIGDDLAAGVWGGMTRMSVGDKRLALNGRYKEQTGFARNDQYDWNSALEKILAAKQVDIAIVMIGSNDRKEFRGADGKFKFASEEWIKAYSASLDKFIAQLKDKGVAVYWLGQPSMNEPAYDDAMKFVSELQKKRAQQAGVRFIETRPSFVDEKDQFAWNGPDVDGVVRRMRAKNGVHFYKRGNNKIANLVLKQLNQDVANAGKEGPAVAVNQPSGVAADQVRQLGDAGNSTTGDNRSGKISSAPIFGIEEEMTALKITPPQLERNRSVSTSGASNIAAATPTGQSVSAVKSLSDEKISPAYETLKASIRPGTPAGQVFLQGLVVTPKVGRVDDNTWPRSE